jgi:hypothetical protein
MNIVTNFKNLMAARRAKQEEARLIALKRRSDEKRIPVIIGGYEKDYNIQSGDICDRGTDRCFELCLLSTDEYTELKEQLKAYPGFTNLPQF